MSEHTIPNNVNIELLFPAIAKKLRSFTFNTDGEKIIALIFSPDLTIDEIATLNLVFDYCSGIEKFNALPDWATWTATEAETNITNAIFNGQDATTIKTNINAQLTNITTANVSQINTRLDVIRILFGNAVDAIIAVRTILVAMGKAIIYLRNLVIKIR